MAILSQSKQAKYSKAIYWGKLISITGGSQAFVQGVGLICGILIIRLLPMKEYAWYTIANAMLGTMTVLADSGISTGIMAEGGKVWQDKKKLGIVLSSGLHLRKVFGVGSLIFTTPVLIYLLLHNGASLLVTLLIIASLIPAFFAALSDTMIETIPKLHQDIPALQKNSIIVSLGRMVLTALSVFIFPFTFVAILAAGIPRIYGNYELKKIASKFAGRKEPPDKVISDRILKIVKRILPGSIYYCLSGQLTIWLISIFGTSSSLAEAGALGRLATVLSLLSALFATLITPRFARLANDSKLLLTRYLQINIGLLFLGAVLVSLMYLFSTQALWILGPQYAHLKNEFILCIIGNYMGLLAGTYFSLNISRGWTINPLFSITINILTIILGLQLINISTLNGLFRFNIFVMTSELIVFLIYGMLQIAKIKTAEKSIL